MLIAFAISLLAGMALGFLFVLVGFAAYTAAPDSANAFYDSPLAALVGFVVGLIPVVIGAVFLTRTVRLRPYLHVTLFGILNVLIAAVSIPFFPDDPITTSDVAYLLVLVPVSLGTCWATLHGAPADAPK